MTEYASYTTKECRPQVFITGQVESETNIYDHLIKAIQASCKDSASKDVFAAVNFRSVAPDRMCPEKYLLEVSLLTDDINFMVTVITLGAGTTENEAIEKRKNTLKRYLQLDSHAFHLLMCPDISTNITTMTNATKYFKEFIFRHYIKKIKIVEITEKAIAGRHEGLDKQVLHARLNFNFALFFEFQAQQQQPLRYYFQYNTTLCACVDGTIEYLLLRVKSVAEFVQFKFCRILPLNIWWHCVWWADQYVVFAELMEMCNVSNALAVADRRYYFQNAAQYTQKRQASFKKICQGHVTLFSARVSKSCGARAPCRDAAGASNHRTSFTGLILLAPPNFGDTAIQFKESQINSLQIDLPSRSTYTKYLQEQKMAVQRGLLIISLLWLVLDRTNYVLVWRRGMLQYLIAQLNMVEHRYRDTLTCLRRAGELVCDEGWVLPTITIQTKWCRCAKLQRLPQDCLHAALGLYACKAQSMRYKREMKGVIHLNPMSLFGAFLTTAAKSSTVRPTLPESRKFDSLHTMKAKAEMVPATSKKNYIQRAETLNSASCDDEDSANQHLGGPSKQRKNKRANLRQINMLMNYPVELQRFAAIVLLSTRAVISQYVAAVIAGFVTFFISCVEIYCCGSVWRVFYRDDVCMTSAILQVLTYLVDFQQIFLFIFSLMIVCVQLQMLFFSSEPLELPARELYRPPCSLGLVIMLYLCCMCPAYGQRDVYLNTWTKPGQGLEVWGAVANDYLGVSVATAGDVNQDGYDDILIGTYEFDPPGRANAGAVCIVFGSPGRTTDIIDTANAMSPKGIKISGAAASDLWGYGSSVRAAGDINQDGIDDFVIGGYNFDPPSRIDAGAAVVIFGKTSGWVDIDLVSFNSGSGGFWIWGAAADDRCGYSVSAAGDVNGDGADDVIVGSYTADYLSRVYSGTSYVIFGHSAATPFPTIDLAGFTSGNAGFRIYGAVAVDFSGASLSGGFDINGDGYSDILIGAQNYDGPGGTDCGAAYVIFGRSTATAFTDIDLAALSSNQGFRITGATASGQLGVSLSKAGDFNGDGYDDIILGSNGNRAYVLFGHSNATLFPDIDLATFTSGTAGFMVSGSGGVGYGVSGGADVNGDGISDVIISAPATAATGIAYVLYGRSQLHFASIDLNQGLQSVSGYRIVGPATGDRSVGLTRDFDGDGVGDVILGASQTDISGRTDGGAAFLIYGELSVPTSQPSRQPTDQPSRQPSCQPTSHPTHSPVRERSGDVDLAYLSTPGQGLEVWGAVTEDYLGVSVATAGDINHDGYEDILIGSLLFDLPGKANAGAVYLVFGSPGRTTDIIDTANAMSPKGIKILGTAVNDNWGFSASAAGDVNQDGIDDFIIGGRFDPPSRTNAGAAVVIFGKTSGWVDIDLVSFTSGSAGFWIWGAADNDYCGNSVSVAGDVNGDGADDIVVGSYTADYLSRVDSGTSYVIFGHSAATPFPTIDLAGFTSGNEGFRIHGATAGDQSGISVSGGFDMNGDGYSDILIGAQNYDGPGGTDCGAAYVIFGHSTATAFTDIDLAALSSNQGFRIIGATASGRLGWSVSKAGDFNGDGYDDIILGSNGNRAYVLFGHSNATLFPDIDLATFTSGTAEFMVSGSGGVGYGVSGGADVNGDGISDVIISAPAAAATGIAYVLYGRSQLHFASIDLNQGLQSVSGYRIVGPAASSAGDWSVGLARDFDSDGVGEVLIGTRYGDPSGRADAGAAFLIYGELSAPSSQPSRQPTSQPSRQPSTQPSRQPSRQPTCQPTLQPTRQPTVVPTSQPSLQPTAQPSWQPTSRPSGQPTSQPQSSPSQQPTSQPSAQPSQQPTGQPTHGPSRQPSSQPTRQPTAVPTSQPSLQPTAQPSWQPTSRPSGQPTSQPQSSPSQQPTSQPSAQPSQQPTGQLTHGPSRQPSSQPTRQPTVVPTSQPSLQPTAQPSWQPTSRPSGQPTSQPQSSPSQQPTSQPSAQPSQQPTGQPTHGPSRQSSSQPTRQPSAMPSAQPSQRPFTVPSAQPSGQPSRYPSCMPSVQPTSNPSAQPLQQPIALPTVQPSSQPSSLPSAQPTRQASCLPSSQPSVAPSAQPSAHPSVQPSRQHNSQPSTQPTAAPTEVVVSSITLECSAVVKTVGRMDVAVQVALRGARDGYVSLYAVAKVGGNTQIGDATDIILQQSSTFTARITGQRQAIVNVTRLLPFTKYDLYCGATSLQGVAMPLQSILATVQPLHTACCKMLTATVLHPATVNLGQELAQAITLAVDAPPSARIEVTVRYTVRNQPNAGVQLLPYVTRYDNISAVNTDKSMSLTPLAAGNYSLSVIVAGPSAEEYTVEYLGTRRLIVLAADATPAAPQLMHAVFSSDGSFVTVSFNSATDRGSLYGTFPCRTLLRFAADKTAQCQWFSDNHLRIYPAAASTGTVLEVGGNVTLVTNTVKAKCTDGDRAAGECASYVPVAPATVIVAAPSAPSLPTVVISAPSAIAACNSLTLDLASSVGAAGRPWDTVSYSVSTIPASSSASERLLQFLTRNYTISPPLPVPSAVLDKGYTYTIKVTLCNFLKACDSATKAVSVAESSAPVPLVTIAGQAVRTIYRTDALSVLADAYTQSCSGSKSSAGLQYSWAILQILPGAVEFANITLRSTSQNPTMFKLSAYTVTVGATYSLTVSVLSTTSGQRSSAAVQLKVARSDLVVVLKGGSTRYAMVGDMMTLDASGSYDKDYPQQPLPVTGVSYSWSCVTVAPLLSTACAVTLLNSDGSGHSSTINVTSTYTALNTTSVISVTVSDASRSSTAQVRIIVLQVPSPRLSITAAGPTDNVNTGKPFTLLGTLYLLTPCAAVWSLDDPTIALATAARTPVKQFLLPGYGSAAVPFNLVIKGDALPQRATLQFTLTCGSTAVSTTVTTNGAPLSGSFLVKPEFGVELFTIFSFTAAQWTDPDLPLTFQFGFQSAVSLSNLVIVSRSELSYATSSLPAGDSSRGSAVDCSLRTFDSLGSFTDRATVVLVTTQDNAEQASQLVLQLLQSSTDSVQGVKAALAVGSSVLNAVNCTAAPNCAPLNRQPCRKTSGQCGSCLDGFAGDAGDRNTLCVALTAPPAQLSATKACVKNCTGHGQCIFVSKVTGGPVAKCTLADADCDATCACIDNYSGEFCEIDPVTLRRRREVRSNLILGLSNLTSQEDINAESVASWSANLYALSIRPHEVSQADAAVLADIANVTLHYAIALKVDSYADMLGVLQATDAVASLLRYNYNPNDYRDADFNTSRSYVNNTAARFIPVVTKFGEMMSSLMILGENETTIVYDNFRMTVALAVGRRIQEPHSVPAGEQQDASTRSSVALQTVADEVVPAIAIKVMSTYPRSYAMDTADYVSSPVRLQVQVWGSQQSLASEYLSSIEFTFWHDTPQFKYENYAGQNFTSICAARNTSQIFSYRCPDSGHVVHHNCSQGPGVHVSYCPKPAAACAVLALETAEITTPSACTVLNSTTAFTTCRCSVRTADLRRRHQHDRMEKQILDAAGVTDMLATTVYIASDFANTFKAAGALNSATLSSVLVVVLLLASVWGAGLGALAVEGAVCWWFPAKAKAVKGRGGVESTLIYIDSVIPKVFDKGTSKLYRLAVEVVEHHVLFRLFKTDKPAERRFLMMEALTGLNVLFFLTAVFFDISQPDDDGTCPDNTTERTCLERSSPFDYSQKYCAWVVDQGVGAGHCVYNDQSMSHRALFYLTVLTTVISSIVAMPIDRLFGTLKAPTALSLEGSKVSSVVDAVVSGARRVSNAGLAFFEPARVAPVSLPTAVPRSRWCFPSLTASTSDKVVANREIPESVEEVGAAARESLAVIGRNASALALGANNASSALRSRSTRAARHNTATIRDASSLPKEDGLVLRSAEPTALATAGTQDDDSAELALMEDVVNQRRFMNSAAQVTKLYDAQWGLQAAGPDSYIILAAAADSIRAAVKESSTEADRLDKELANYSLQHAGLEILHLFMLDLLGKKTLAAKVFQEKFGEEFGHSSVVVEAQKLGARFALLGANAFFMYYVVLKGFQKGLAWQEQYVACCLVQVGVDILLFETVECAWLNYLVPQYVHDEVANAAEKLRSLTQQIARTNADAVEAQPAPEEAKFFLNAPQHLFVSTKLAKKKSQLLESMIVGSYRHYLPGEICKTWPHCAVQKETQQHTTQLGALVTLFGRILRGLTLALNLFMGVQYTYQKVVLRLCQPIVFSGIAMIFYAIFTSIAGQVVLGIVALTVVGNALPRWWALKGRSVTAVALDAAADKAEEPIFLPDIVSNDSSTAESQEVREDESDDSGPNDNGNAGGGDASAHGIDSSSSFVISPESSEADAEMSCEGEREEDQSSDVESEGLVSSSSDDDSEEQQSETGSSEHASQQQH